MLSEQEVFIHFFFFFVVIIIFKQAKKCKSIEITYKLDENIYSKAIVENFDKVCIWLGANIMVEYEREEAIKMLETNLDSIVKA